MFKVRDFQKKIRYVISGLLTLGFNLLLAMGAFSIPGVKDDLVLKNIANIVVTEISLLFSFFAHTIITWQSPGFESFARRIIAFHIVSATSLAIRFALFALLVYLGAHWFVATFSTIITVLVINYLGYDRFVFGRGGRKEWEADGE